VVSCTRCLPVLARIAQRSGAAVWGRVTRHALSRRAGVSSLYRGLRPPDADTVSEPRPRRRSAPHAVRIIKTAEQLAGEGESYHRLGDNLATLGYRGHPITKSGGYSVTFGQIRRAKRLYRSRPASLEPDADIRELLDDDVPEGFETVSSFAFVGQGYLDLDAAAAAVRSATAARTR
jgi:hypothetical protein